MPSFLQQLVLLNLLATTYQSEFEIYRHTCFFAIACINCYRLNYFALGLIGEHNYNLINRILFERAVFNDCLCEITQELIVEQFFRQILGGLKILKTLNTKLNILCLLFIESHIS